MNSERYRRIWSIVLLSSLALLLIGEVAAVLFIQGSSDLSVENHGRRGLSIAYGSVPDDMEKRILLTSPTLLLENDDPSRTLFISIGPQREYSLTEVFALQKFYDRGGKLLIADDSGRVNPFVGRFDITVVEGQLYDETFQDHPDKVKVDDIQLDPFSGFLVMNKPSSLIFSSGQGFIRSSPSSWVDRNGNGIMDNLSSAQGEAPGPRYLAVSTDPDFQNSQSGNLLVLSDPSLFMNGMIDEADNKAFFRALIEHQLPDGGEVVFDESVHDSSGGTGIIQRSTRIPVLLVTDINLKIVVGTMIAISLFAIAYVHDPPGVHRHESILDRTGVAEIVDPGISDDDRTELRKVFLDRVRVTSGLSMEGFSELSWDQLRTMIGNEILFGFAKDGELPGEMDMNNMLVEVSTWERK